MIGERRLTPYEYNKRFRDKHREKYNASMLSYYHKNKEKINRKRREKYVPKKKPKKKKLESSNQNQNTRSSPRDGAGLINS
jgi:hypothetical protein